MRAENIEAEKECTLEDEPQTRGRLWFVAHLEGVVNGQVIANRLILSLLGGRTAVTCCPLGATGWEKVWAALRLTMAALRSAPEDRVYLSLPGQLGGWLLLAALVVFRRKGAGLFLHHHSYRPLRAGPGFLGRVLVRAAGPAATHILLSPTMAKTFAKRYLPPGFAPPLILSNAALLPPPQPPVMREGPFTIGFLGAWTKDKGVDCFLDVAEGLLAEDPALEVALAGAPRDSGDPVVTTITAMIARWPGRFTVHDWLDGADKTAFLDRLDCLLLPSSLPDEAEPLTLLEAYSAGADVMATAIGAIPERIRSPDCLLALNSNADLDRIARMIERRRAERDAATRQCREHALRLHRAGLPALQGLLRRLTGERKAAAPRRLSAAESEAA